MKKKKKLDLYTFTKHQFAFKIKYYVNLDSLEILEEYDFSLLPKEQQERCELIPQPSLKQHIEFMKSFLQLEEYNKYSEILEEYLKEGKNSEGYKCNGDNVSDEIYGDTFFYMCNDKEIWEQYSVFRFNEAKKIAINFCKERNIEYYYKIPPKMSIKKERELIRKLLNDKDRMKFYEEHY